MGIILNPADAVEFRPRDDGPTYLLRPPTVADRSKYKEAVSVEGGENYRHLDLLNIIRRALDRLLPPTDDNAEIRAESIAIIEEYRQTLQGLLDERDANRTEETNKAVIDALVFPDNLARLIEALRDGDRELRRAFAKNETYWFTAGPVATKMFLVGWEGLGAFKRGLTGPTEATLKQISLDEMALIALRIESMMQPDEARIKNSDLPSSGPVKETKSSGDGKITRRNGHSQDVTATA